MKFNKDYYSILGVLASAEDVVIRAAYKALAQRYHPDKNQGSTIKTDEIMADISEAYNILSNKEKRAEYDEYYKSSNNIDNEYFRIDDDIPPEYDPLDIDWSIATKYHPNLLNMEKMLEKISWRLSYSFKAYLLSKKNYDEGVDVAKTMKHEFLKEYFGDNRIVLMFAEELINTSQKAAAKELNRTVRVLGDCLDPNTIVMQIKEEHNLISNDRINEIASVYIRKLNNLGCFVKKSDGGWLVTFPAGETKIYKTTLDLMHLVDEVEKKGKQSKVSEKGGLLVTSVGQLLESDTNAVMVDDIILKIGGKDVRNNKKLFEDIISNYKNVKDVVEIELIRKAVLIKLSVFGDFQSLKVVQLA